jgi:hypothetical protein
MQGFEILLMILVLVACQPSKKTQDAPVESEPAAIGNEPKAESIPAPSADQKPRLQTCLAKASPPRLLSETGCVDPKNPAQPAASVVPYDVIAPL